MSGGWAGRGAWACAAAAGGARSRSAPLRSPRTHIVRAAAAERPGARCQCGAGAAHRGRLHHRGGNFTSPPGRGAAEAPGGAGPGGEERSGAAAAAGRRRRRRRRRRRGVLARLGGASCCLIFLRWKKKTPTKQNR